MPDFFRAAAALGLVASLTTATNAFAIDASNSAIEQTASADAQHAIELVSAGVTAKAADDPNCPSVTLAPAGDTRKADGAKATLDALARDCANLGAETIVKVGVVGESVRKKKGDAAGYDAPMTIQVKDDQGRDVETRKINLRVEMAEGVQKVSFQHVEENVSLPPPSANGYANWTIVVGLDPAAPDDGVAETASVDESADETPKASRSSRYGRSTKSYRSRSARSRAVKVARSRSGRQQIALQPAPDPAAVVVSAKPQQGAPAAQVTTTTVAGSEGGVMARAAAGFTERRDRALQQQQITAAQQRAAAARAQGRAAAAQPQPAARTAQQAPARPAVQTAQTN